MARIRLSVKSWKEFQHYKDRSPAWIKLHRSLLDNFDWHRLPDASKALAPMVWLLASEYETGEIDTTIEELCFRLRMTAEKFEASLNPLIEAGFLVVEREASTPLAKQERKASLEEEREKEDKREVEERTGGALAPSPTADAVELFNQAADEHDWPKVQVLNEGRKRALVGCLKAVGDLEGWQALLAKVAASDFLMGRTARSDDHANWRVDFDFLVKPKRYIKIMEGGYGNSSKAPANRTGIGAVLAALAE